MANTLMTSPPVRSPASAQPFQPSPQAQPIQPAQLSPHRRAAAAVARLLMPFLLALGLGLGFRVYMTYRASDTLAEVAISLRPTWVEKNGVSQAVFPDIKLPPPAQEINLGYQERLINTLKAQWSHDQIRDTSDRNVIRHDIFFALLSEYLSGVIALQAIGLLFFPSLFATNFFTAARGIARFASDSARAVSFSFEDRIQVDRYEYWLSEEAGPWFWRRFTFGMLLVFAINFFTSPAGMQASIIGDYIALRPSLGESSHPFAFEAFVNAPPYVVGLAGYYLYALTTATSRFMAGSLSHRLLPSLITRAITVVIMSLVMSSITQGDSMSRAIVFLVGVFPELGVKYLSKISQAALGALPNAEQAGFAALPEIDLGKQAALAEVGVSSMQELAVADWKHLVERIGISPRLLVRSADRALLIFTLGIERAQKLATLGIFSACDLVLYVRGEDAYRWRWEGAGLAIPPGPVTRLPVEEQERRLRVAAESADCQDLALIVDSLIRDRNVHFGLDNRVVYGTL